MLFLQCYDPENALVNVSKQLMLERAIQGLNPHGEFLESERQLPEGLSACRPVSPQLPAAISCG